MSYPINRDAWNYAGHGTRPIGLRKAAVRTRAEMSSTTLEQVYKAATESVAANGFEA